MSSDEIAIKVDHVSKSFRLPHERSTSIKSVVVNFWRHKRSYETQKVLDDVSFEIKKGEFFGLVGRNGSGKSTLLKLLAGIYTPSKGHIALNGTLSPFIELGVGFNPELTGRENVFLNGALLGFSRKEMLGLYDQIVEFAELERFMDQKLKNYSSGMQVRLAFSIAIRAKSDILVFDEVLAVGDAAFQRKCLEHFGILKESKQTVVFVSHDMASMQKYCDKVVWIDNGKIKDTGDPETITQEYMETFISQAQDDTDSGSNKGLPLGISSAVNIDTSLVEIKKAWVENGKRKTITSLGEKDETYTVKFQIKARKDLPGVVPGVIVTNDMGEFISASNSKWAGGEHNLALTKGKTYEVAFKMLNILEQGAYKISVNVVSQDLSTFYAWQNKAYTLECNKIHATGGKVNPKFEVGMVASS